MIFQSSILNVSDVFRAIVLACAASPVCASTKGMSDKCSGNLILRKIVKCPVTTTGSRLLKGTSTHRWSTMLLYITSASIAMFSANAYNSKGWDQCRHGHWHFEQLVGFTFMRFREFSITLSLLQHVCSTSAQKLSLAELLITLQWIWIIVI